MNRKTKSKRKKTFRKENQDEDQIKPRRKAKEPKYRYQQAWLEDEEDQFEQMALLFLSHEWGQA